jgi:hypothetical protein
LKQSIHLLVLAYALFKIIHEYIIESEKKFPGWMMGKCNSITLVTVRAL